MDLQNLTDFVTLAAGVRAFSLFNLYPTAADQYFLEFMNIMVEVKQILNFTFLLQRRPDIFSLAGEGFDFDIIHEAFDDDIVEDDQYENHGQCEIDFREVAENEETDSIKNVVIEEADDDSDKDEQPLDLTMKKKDKELAVKIEEL